MTKTNMDLSKLLAKHDQGDFLRSVAEAVLQLIMEADVEGLIGAGKHERSGERTTWRNGYRERALRYPSGHAEPAGSQLRQGSYFPGASRSAQDLGNRRWWPASRRAWISGVSDPSRRGAGAAGRLSGISKSTVFEAVQGHRRTCRRVPEPPAQPANGPISGSTPTYLKVRQADGIVPVAGNNRRGRQHRGTP